MAMLIVLSGAEISVVQIKGLSICKWKATFKWIGFFVNATFDFFSATFVKIDCNFDQNF